MSQSKSVFRVGRFPFFIRQAEQVARAIASTLTPFPSILSEDGEKQKNGSAVTCFRFEGGVEVAVELFNLDRLTESWRTPHVESWVVFKAEAIHYASDDPYHEQAKVSTQFDVERLKGMREQRMWHHPHVCSMNDICGQIGIFIDRAAGTGEVEVDPEFNQSGHAILVENLPYRVLVPGDKERVIRKAQQRMLELLPDRD